MMLSFICAGVFIGCLLAPTQAAPADADIAKLLEGLNKQADIIQQLEDALKLHDKNMASLDKLLKTHDTVLGEEDEDLKKLDETIELMEKRLRVLAFAQYDPFSVKVNDYRVYFSRHIYLFKKHDVAKEDCHKIGGHLPQFELKDLQPIGKKLMEEGLGDEQFYVGRIEDPLNPNQDLADFQLYNPKNNTLEEAPFVTYAYSLCAVPIKNDE